MRHNFRYLLHKAAKNKYRMYQYGIDKSCNLFPSITYYFYKNIYHNGAPTRQLRYRTVPYTDNYDGRFTLVCRAMYTASSYRLKPAQTLCQLKKEKFKGT